MRVEPVVVVRRRGTALGLGRRASRGRGARRVVGRASGLLGGSCIRTPGLYRIIIFDRWNYHLTGGWCLNK